MSNSIVLDWRELQLKWAVDEVITSTEKLITLLDKIDDIEIMDGIVEHLQAIHDYVAAAPKEFNGAKDDNN